jgi:uncharacterized OB-fold protein
MSDSAVTLGREIPCPAISVETKPFWDAAEKGVFMIKRCNTCDEPFWYPRALCPFCGSEDTSWVESAGQGVIYSYSIMRRAPTGPYAVAFVTLDDGPTMLTNIVGCGPDDLAIGARVSLRWQKTEGGPPAPVFGLA